LRPQTTSLRRTRKTREPRALGKRRQRARINLLERLWRAYRRSRGLADRNALVEAYQDLVRDLARRFAHRLPRSVDPGDLATAANVGLIAAIESFDHRRRVPFESYCEVRVKGALIDELRAQDWLPRPWRTRVEQHKRALERLRADLAREPSDDELAHALGLSHEEYRELFAFALPGAPSGSMSNAPGIDDPVHSLEVVPDREQEAPSERLTREELLHLVTQKLSPQEYRIVYLKYWEDLPMREIGELEGVSESRVCKIHSRLVERLQERFGVHAQAAGAS
jgi:RNA polymerase sigma factor for flagellar operon FliA